MSCGIVTSSVSTKGRIPEEIKDREIYRRMYLDQFKAQVREHLDNIEIVDDKDFKN